MVPFTEQMIKQKAEGFKQEVFLWRKKTKCLKGGKKK